MPTTFYRLHTDQTRVDVALEDAFASVRGSACWLIGGGPSLVRLPYREIDASPVPKMCVNLSGARLLRPTFWTSYDPTPRFLRSVYLDAGVMKFVHRRRAMDCVPETTDKVCDCPNTYFFDRDPSRGFADFLRGPGFLARANCSDGLGSPSYGKGHDRASGIVDWADSMVQAMDILYRLGFRTLYLAGCEMRVSPSREQIALAAARGVAYDRRGLLTDFLRACEAAGISRGELEALPAGEQYHFGERKPLRAAANTDFHYFRVVQYLRLSRRAMSLAGLRLVSVTPHSRLNDHFDYEPARAVLRHIAREIADPRSESTAGLYHRQEPRLPRHIGPMRDFVPHNWKQKSPPKEARLLRKSRASDSAGIVVAREGFEPVTGTTEQ